MKGLDPMPATSTSAPDFDDLLGDLPTPEEKENLTSLESAGEPVETPEAARIRVLEEQLAEFKAKEAAAPAEKTTEQKQAEHNATVRNTSAVLSAPDAFEEADGDTIDIHILSTGFTFADRVWQLGQNLSIARGGKAYQDTVDRRGDSWLNDLSIAEQYRRFGKVVVGEGFYQGPAFKDEVARQDARRGTAAPVININ